MAFTGEVFDADDPRVLEAVLLTWFVEVAKWGCIFGGA